MDLLSLLTSVPGLISDFSGSSQPYRKQQEQLAGQQQQISGALAQGPANPLYQQLYGQYQQQNKSNMAQMIAEAQGQNRMNANMGRTPLFSNERGSENIFRTMMQQYQNMGAQSDQQTRGALTQAMGASGQAGGAYNQLTPYSNMQTAQQLQGPKDIYQLLTGGTNGATGYMGGGNYNNQAMAMMRGNQQPQQPNYNSFNTMQNQGYNQMSGYQGY